jgi:ribosome-binding factor A
VREALAEVLREDVSDPRLDFATITSVQVSSDLGVADVYVTTHGDQERYDELLEGLHSADGRIRSGLARRVKLRITPELRYHLDTSVDQGMRIYEALKNVPPSMAGDE